MWGDWFNENKNKKMEQKLLAWHLIDNIVVLWNLLRQLLFVFFFFIRSIADSHIYRNMINEFIYKNIKMSRSGFYMKSP